MKWQPAVGKANEEEEFFLKESVVLYTCVSIPLGDLFSQTTYPSAEIISSIKVIDGIKTSKS